MKVVGVKQQRTEFDVVEKTEEERNGELLSCLPMMFRFKPRRWGMLSGRDTAEYQCRTEALITTIRFLLRRQPPTPMDFLYIRYRNIPPCTSVTMSLNTLPSTHPTSPTHARSRYSV
jgi:hypothetical protein